MKKATGFLAILLLVQSCKKDSVNGPDHVNANVRFNGNNYAVSENNSTSVGRYEVPLFGGEYVSVTGWTSSVNKLQIIMPPYPQPGTFDFMSSGDFSASYYDGTSQVSYETTDGSGTITIESITSSHIKGSFRFDCFNAGILAVEVTNGTFEGDL